LEAFDAIALPGDHANNLMAQHERQLGPRQLSIDDMQIGAAHRARADLDQDFARARTGNWNFGRAEQLPLNVKDHRFHGVIENGLLKNANGKLSTH
jgi:hypothetical protein